jgi:hypothetical protein
MKVLNGVLTIHHALHSLSPCTVGGRAQDGGRAAAISAAVKGTVEHALYALYALSSYTVLIHCTHTLSSYTLLIHCPHTLKDEHELKSTEGAAGEGGDDAEVGACRSV